MRHLIVHGQRALIIALHLILAAAANWCAFWLRFDGSVPEWAVALQLEALPILLVLRAVSLVYFHSYESVWRYTSIWDLRNLGLATVCSTVVFYAALTLVVAVALTRVGRVPAVSREADAA